MIGWVGYARLVRGQALRAREFEFVQAARACGAGPARIVLRHILPTAIPAVVVQATLGMAGAIIGGLVGAGALGFDVITGAGADRLLAAGSVPTSLAEFDAESTPLDGKHYGVAIAPGDVVRMHSGGGGGLGDPLDRETQLVAADVRDGAISRENAGLVYGVALTSDGEVDERATAALRAAARDERLSWTADPSDHGFRVRITQASERLAALGGWSHPRAGVNIIERADGQTGSLVGVAVQVDSNA